MGSSVTPIVKKVIHFLTHKECPDFDGPKSKIARNCPKIIFAFDRKIPNSKTKLKNEPLKSKNTFLTVKKVIHFLTHKERPDFDGPKSKIAQNCPKIIFGFYGKIPNSKLKLKNDPLKSKKCFLPVKKVIHFLTHKELPDFDGPKSKIARNCPKIILPTRSFRIEIFILRNY